MQPFAPPRSGSPWPELHLEDIAWLRTLFATDEPTCLIYAHAVCDVGNCEADPAWAKEINVHHVDRLLTVLPDSTKLVYLSSDHVFGGDGSYDEASSPSPISVYGATRVAAEQRVLSRPGSLVIRAGLAIGPSANGRAGFLDWLAYRHRQGLPITVVHDESRSAIWADDLATRIMQLAHSDLVGLVHVAASASVSRVDLARHLARCLGIDLVYDTAGRHQRPAPHLGRVELSTTYNGHLHEPIPSVLLSTTNPALEGDRCT